MAQRQHDSLPKAASHRKRSGWQRYVENILVGLCMAVYFGLTGLMVYWTMASLHWNAVIAISAIMVATFFVFEGFHKLMYHDDF